MIAMFGLSITLQRRHPVWMVMAIAACLLVAPTALVLFFLFCDGVSGGRLGLERQEPGAGQDS